MKNKKYITSNKLASSKYVLYIYYALTKLEHSSKYGAILDMSDYQFLIDENGEYPKFNEDVVVKPLKGLGYEVSSTYKDGKPYLIIEDKKESKND